MTSSRKKTICDSDFFFCKNDYLFICKAEWEQEQERETENFSTGWFTLQIPACYSQSWAQPKRGVRKSMGSRMSGKAEVLVSLSTSSWDAHEQEAELETEPGCELAL